MLFRSAAAVIAIFASSAQAAVGTYDYDHVDTWNNDFTAAAGTGFCGGRKQSPIALETMECSVYANYEMNVSCLQLSLTSLPSVPPY